ncbi:hypothetical protein Pmar_PMAR005158 [Perkinsus marinus ATCC 50983]|uniref:BCD1 alpha/beta domain-containing protein n=1 Tax=Perkinsus marinus (strain ATCC 50983 / TXsc) TaxID=423536 RepID=C5KAS7_PERM5|nr:hypothetical protein Pmar_PMAR005158 [Perkinsus marinus ATCC 50983]EER18253.1 hypothetical protein Pmar_PMAR005158 [Perkinsus marinus ATCC 50983]|eukprot:XP_002786457.1 hypothetical protein Pmar_PMAR005158 [Perkinsus marinus ATCC 50983]
MMQANLNEANAEPTAPEDASAAPVATTSPNECAEGTAETSNQAVKEPAPAQEPVVQWKIEWRFQAAKEGTDEVVLNEVSSEETKVGDLLEALVTNKWRRDLSNTVPEYIEAGPGKVSVFMKVLMAHKPHTYHDESPYNNTEQDLSRCNKFWPVDVNKSIKENLYYRVVVEHPVFIVTLEPAKFPVLVEDEQPILEVQKEEAPAPEPSKPEISLAEDLPPPAPSSGKGGWQQHSSRKGGKGFSGKGQWTGQYKGGGREWQNNSGNDGWWNAGKGGGKGSESWYWGPQYPPQPNEWQGGNWNAGWNASGDSWGPGGKGSSKGGDWGQGKGAYYNSSKGGW